MRDTCQAKVRQLLGCAGLFVAIAACSRTGLELGDLDPDADGIGAGATAGMGQPEGGTGPSTAGAPSELPDAAAPLDASMPTPPTGTSEPPEEPPSCTPSEETCNGRDDDCDGQVDELPGVACPGGGFQYCVAGRLSDCPRSCQVCVPGSLRICQNTFCTFWGEQECAADGQGFGPCRESVPPSRCAGIARRSHRSPELEQCCLDDGYCCLDVHDLDGDGDRHEMLGACDGVRCP